MQSQSGAANSRVRCGSGPDGHIPDSRSWAGTYGRLGQIREFSPIPDSRGARRAGKAIAMPGPLALLRKLGCGLGLGPVHRFALSLDGSSERLDCLDEPGEPGDEPVDSNDHQHPRQERDECPDEIVHSGQPTQEREPRAVESLQDQAGRGFSASRSGWGVRCAGQVCSRIDRVRSWGLRCGGRDGRSEVAWPVRWCSSSYRLAYSLSLPPRSWPLPSP